MMACRFRRVFAGPEKDHAGGHFTGGLTESSVIGSVGTVAIALVFGFQAAMLAEARAICWPPVHRS
jgi:hypothetical protein